VKIGTVVSGSGCPILLTGDTFSQFNITPQKDRRTNPPCGLLRGRKGKTEMAIEKIIQIMQLLLTFGNICIIGYAFLRFLGKPHDNLETRVNTIELEIAEIKRSLMQGNDRFREQAKTNEVLIRATLALLEFEVHYCETEQKPISKNLEKAKDDLNEYFSKVRA
jgi:hypothetical protein